MAKKFVELHEGKIWVESEVGQRLYLQALAYLIIAGNLNFNRGG